MNTGADYSSLDLSIVGDEEEHNRILLENNLQDLSIHFQDDHEHPRRGPFKPGRSVDETGSTHSLEFPRHNPHPPSSIFHGNSFLTDQADDLDPHNLYSFRTADDDPVYPIGDTISTASHHASALTLRAGLGGRKTRRADLSHSGAEFDPDRPVHRVVKGFPKDTSMFRVNSPSLDHARNPNNSSSLSSSSEPSTPELTSAPLPRPADLTNGSRRASSGRVRPRPAVHLQPPSPQMSFVEPKSTSEKQPRRDQVKIPFRTQKSQARAGQNSILERSRQTDKLQLPDVTGLTSAVGSPLKANINRMGYNSIHGVGGNTEVYLIQTLTSLQTKLNQLESQNLISRRRVRELELELEACRAEVKRERTRVLEREEIIVAQQKEADRRRKGKGKASKMHDSVADESRYNEVLDEKKALEALVGTLRTHLKRLTTELSSHQALISELQALREVDVRAVEAKGSDIEGLKQEVERLGGEVEVLRGVIEEGLKERRRAKDSQDISHDVSQPVLPIHHGEVSQRSNTPELTSTIVRPLRNHSRPVTPPSPPLPILKPYPPVPADRTTRTDRATVGSSSHGQMATRYIQNEEIERVQADIDERRSEGSPSLNGSRVVAETNDIPQTPFPQIRGEQLERLFFSAPEHNVRTCAVCHRRKKPADDSVFEPSWLPRPPKAAAGEDEGFEEPDDDRPGKSLDGDRESYKAPDMSMDDDRLRPQTVLTRVLRELEDDFTHYKGIYVELADQYKIMDATSNVTKRNVLAQHLKEVVDTLEHKGNQIASLFDLLAFKDKPCNSPAPPTLHRAPKINRRRVADM